MHQSVFLFDYQRFRQDITPVLEAVDRGDNAPLHEWYDRVAQSMKPEEWILHDEGTYLDDYEPGEPVDNCVLGYWLLVALSTYLRRLPPPLANWPLPNWPLFGTALYFADQESWHLLGGSSIASLIKPGSEASIPQTVSNSDPYWYWVRPLHGYGATWLSVEQIRSLEQRVVSKHDAIMAVDQKLLAEWTFALEDMEDFERLARLQIGHDDALKMLRTALQQNAGLFTITS